jgi:hypothetical protein
MADQHKRPVEDLVKWFEELLQLASECGATVTISTDNRTDATSDIQILIRSLPGPLGGFHISPTSSSP